MKHQTHQFQKHQTPQFVERWTHAWARIWSKEENVSVTRGTRWVRKRKARSALAGPTLPAAGLPAASSALKCTLARSYAMSMSDLAPLELAASNRKGFFKHLLYSSVSAIAESTRSRATFFVSEAEDKTECGILKFLFIPFWPGRSDGYFKSSHIYIMSQNSHIRPGSAYNNHFGADKTQSLWTEDCQEEANPSNRFSSLFAGYYCY